METRSCQQCRSLEIRTLNGWRCLTPELHSRWYPEKSGLGLGAILLFVFCLGVAVGVLCQ